MSAQLSRRCNTRLSKHFGMETLERDDEKWDAVRLFRRNQAYADYLDISVHSALNYMIDNVHDFG